MNKLTDFFPANEICCADFDSFTAFDIETTGLPRNSNIIELGAVKVTNGIITDRFNELIDPLIPIPSRITYITGITNSMVRGCDTIDKVLPRFAQFAGDDILLGHNVVSFDCPIVRHWANIHGIFIKNDVFDTLRHLRSRCEPFPGMTSKSLEYLCDYFNIEASVHHRADADAEITAKLYFILKQNAKLKNQQ